MWMLKLSVWGNVRHYHIDDIVKYLQKQDKNAEWYETDDTVHYFKTRLNGSIALNKFVAKLTNTPLHHVSSTEEFIDLDEDY